MRYRLIELLADGRFRSGEWLGQQLGISRAAVWKHVQALPELGLDVHAVRGQGYRLSAPFSPLNGDLINAVLPAPVASRIEAMDVFQEIDSTSDHLKRTCQPSENRGGRVCIAEWQSAGRGRRGRRWVSPYGSNLYLSLAWHLNAVSLQSGGLSLAMAVSVLRALRRCGIQELGLKWPNDIYYQGRKLAGILLDLSGESAGPFLVVIGIGINLNLPASAASSIDQPWADLSQCGMDIDRNQLAALVVEALVEGIDSFNREGLSAFVEEWERFDLITGHPVKLHHDNEATISGVARGIDAQGALLIEQDGGTRSFHAGEVSVRLVG